LRVILLPHIVNSNLMEINIGIGWNYQRVSPNPKTFPLTCQFLMEHYLNLAEQYLFLYDEKETNCPLPSI
jgi:hypothetical protein